MSGNTSKPGLLKRLAGHIVTVHRHRKEVRRCCFACGLYRQGITHDLSKYSPSELFESVRYYQGYRSPYSYEKELFGYAPGWLHHKGRNKHHWEYWYDLRDSKFSPLPMPFRYLAESVCDRVAACRTYQKDQYTQESALKYFLEKPERLSMHPDTAAEMERILRDIAENGEDAAFAHLREELKKRR